MKRVETSATTPSGHNDDVEWGEPEKESTETPAAPSFPRVLLAELLGTGMIVLFGCGSVCSGLSGAYSGIWQTSVVWGIGVSLAIMCTGVVSGAERFGQSAWVTSRKILFVAHTLARHLHST